jgi:hypothetical protein
MSIGRVNGRLSCAHGVHFDDDATLWFDMASGSIRKLGAVNKMTNEIELVIVNATRRSSKTFLSAARRGAGDL